MYSYTRSTRVRQTKRGDEEYVEFLDSKTVKLAYQQRRRLQLTLLAVGSVLILKRTPQELSALRATINVIVLHSIHQTIIIITGCHAIASEQTAHTISLLNGVAPFVSASSFISS